jgi:hypothetical protein
MSVQPRITYCAVNGCLQSPYHGSHFCSQHLLEIESHELQTVVGTVQLGKATPTMSEKYPKYYKQIPKGMTEIDVYGVCKLFPVADDTGCIRHATKKLLVPGTRTGGKSFRDDIKEARDTLTRWLELNPE